MRISDWSSDVCSSDLILLFKRLWAEIAETRVQPFSIVIDFDVIKHLFLGGGSGDKTFAVYRLDLEAVIPALHGGIIVARSEEHTSKLQSLMRISYAVFCLKKKKHNIHHTTVEAQYKI